MRPIYETEKDLREEAAIAAAFSSAWKAEFIKLKKLYAVDYAIMRDGAVAGWAEIKRRYRDMHQFPSLYVTLKKAIDGIALSEYTSKPFLYLVRFNDATCYVTITRPMCNRPIKISGRTDRGDPDDRQPCLEINNDELKVI